jgi:hypothetical protein
MRLAPIATLASISAAVAAFACSAGQPPTSSGSSDATDPSASDSASAASAAPVASSAAPVATPTTPIVALDAGLTEAGTVIPLPLPTGTIPIPGTIPPIGTNLACVAGSIPETEPNNDVTTPNMIPAVTSTFCGHVDPGDVDVVGFIMPANVRGFGFGLDAANGFLNLQPFAAGQPFSFQGNYPFEPGQLYTIQVSSADGQPISGPSSSSGDSGPGSSSGDIVDSGPPIDGGDAGTLCEQGSQMEVEDNGTTGSANTLPSESSTFCGTISPGSDVDYVKFVLPVGATAFGIQDKSTNGAAIKVEPSDNGTPFDLSSSTYPFNIGDTYMLKISSNSATTTFDYRIEVSITK